MLFDAGTRGVVEVDRVESRPPRGEVGILDAKAGEKLPFDAGRYGEIGVDRIEYRKDRATGLLNPGDETREVAYTNYGGTGCVRSEWALPEGDPPQARARREERMLDWGARTREWAFRQGLD